MITAIALAVFLAAMFASLYRGMSMLLPIALGACLFFAAAVLNGANAKQLAKAAAKSLKGSLIVVRILLVIGALTGLWRASGTIACFVDAGIRYMPRTLYLPAMFLLSSAMSFALGTSFGVTATGGVILMSAARAGGADPLLCAGAILSGVYVGDRGSPSASSASLVAAVTGTDVRRNVRAMLRRSPVPYAACLALYTALSLAFPAPGGGTQAADAIRSLFDTSLWCLLPALLMTLLPFLKVPILWCMALSALASGAVAVLVQGMGLETVLLCAWRGYRAADPALDAIFGGGGLVSMLEVCGILLLSGTYGALLRGTGLLDRTDALLRRLSSRIGRYGSVLASSVLSCALFCNQTIGIIMLSHLTSSLYGPLENEERMLDMEDTVITVAGLVPWCIAFSVPAGMLGVGAAVIPLCFWLYLVPAWGCVLRLLKKKRRDKL